MTAPVIECISHRDLVSFAEASAIEGRRGGVVAISGSRARAWQQNPSASPDDTALLVARVEGRCAGYLGVMPARVRIDGSDERVDWLSAFHVSREWSHAGVASLLLMRACGLGHSLAASGLPAGVTPILGKLGFVNAGGTESGVLDFAKYNKLGLPFRALSRVAAEADLHPRVFERANGGCAALTKKCVMPLLRAALAPSRRIHTKQLEGLQDGAFERVADQRHPRRFLRDAAVIDWMLRHPWVTTNGLEEVPGYRFDDFRSDAQYRLLDLHDEGGPWGFLVLSLTTHRGVREVRLLDHHLYDPADALLLPSIVLEHAANYAADRVVLPEVCRAAIGSSGLARRLFSTRQGRTHVRPGRSATALRGSLQNLRLDDCDGDSSFT